MPLPLIPIIFGAASLGAAAHGVKKGIEAKNDMDLAKSVNSEAQDIAKRAERKIKESQEDTKTAIEDLGQQKIEVLSGSINDFVETFERIKNVEFQDSTGLDELRKFTPQSAEFKQLKEVSMEAKDVAVNGLSALGGGALLAFGTYNVVMGGVGGLLVTATTGTALGSLSGVAATNATLAWLGGGALSVGGLGMAGGMAVLGGIVAGPALALGGSLFAKKADEAYWNAHSNREKAREFAEQAEGICSSLNAIRKRANQLTQLLSDLDLPFTSLVSDMEAIVWEHGANWKNYTVEEKSQIKKCVQTALVIKMILDTSLLSEDGKLLSESKHALKKGRDYLALIY